MESNADAKKKSTKMFNVEIRSESSCCVYAAQFSKDATFSRVCAGGSGSHEARLFDTHSGDVRFEKECFILF